MKRTLKQFLKLTCSRPNMDNAELHFRRLREGIPLVSKQDLLFSIRAATNSSHGRGHDDTRQEAKAISAAND